MELPEDIKSVFYNYLFDELPIEDVEQWVYSNEPTLTAISEDLGFELISFNYKQPGAKHVLYSYLYSYVIDKADYAEWLIRKYLRWIVLKENWFRASIRLYNEFWDDHTKFTFLRTLCDYSAPCFREIWEGGISCDIKGIKEQIIAEYLLPEMVQEASYLLDELDSGKIIITGEYSFTDSRTDTRSIDFNDIRTEINRLVAVYGGIEN